MLDQKNKLALKLAVDYTEQTVQVRFAMTNLIFRGVTIEPLPFAHLQPFIRS